MITLLYGVGNPGRQDDGLGVELVDRLEQWALVAGCTNLRFDSNYQLNAEDTLAVSEVDRVIFVDAAKDGDAPFRFEPIAPHASWAFSTHFMPPESILALCRDLYARTPKAWILAIRGYEWEVGAPLTEQATANLIAAEATLKSFLMKPA